MEARSLSSLNFLAANPPQYPTKPSEEKLDSLTLYILRVPGTRDVFLSPFKPQLKSVTAEDIASSLYYVHLRDTLEGCSQTRAEEISHERSSSQPNIARKPLPSTARPHTPDSPPRVPQVPAPSISTQYEPDPVHHETSSGHQMKGSPLGRIVTPAQLPSTSDPARVPARKPLGPRPMASSPTAFHDQQHTLSIGRDDPLAVLPRPQTQGTGVHGRFSAEHGSLPGPPLDGSTWSGTFSLDLIRRDRSSGGQWNVARISCQGTAILELSESAGWRRSPSPSKQGPRPVIDISIENSGYAKFRNIPLPSVVEAGPAAIMSALAERDSGRSSDHSSNLSHPFPGDGSAALADPFRGSHFTRQVTMGYTKSWTASVKEKLQKLEVEAKSRARRGHRRDDSATSWDSFEQKSSLPDTGSEGMRPCGYTFTSPWNGRCDFRTGNGGRTLRLTHALDNGGANESPPADVAVVSELRFNLPTSEVIAGTAHPRDSQLLSHFGNALRTRARSDPYRNDGEFDDTEHHPRFDLSLGKERAGGGRRGNRAKMGKLIITNEGLKMLDLVVAANIGVWWETWEKSF